MSATKELEPLPAPVIDMLKNNSLAHLATCADNVPSVSLMKFTYIEPSHRYEPNNAKQGVIVLATSKDSTKYKNIQKNPNISLLIHDWVTMFSRGDGIAEYLQRLNHHALSQLSITLTGYAKLITGEQAEYYRKKLLLQHQGSECYIKDNPIVLVEVTSAKIADAENHIREVTTANT